MPALLLMICIALILIYRLGYHGPRTFVTTRLQADVQDVVANARSLKAAPYDPWMGGHDNIGAKFGFIVCSDVVNIAYGLSGFSWQQALQSDFLKHASFYNSRDGNNPSNPYFHRRARNLFAYFKANHRLESLDYVPVPGDLVFYRKLPRGAIAHVTLVTEAYANQYRVMESAPRTLFAQEVADQSPLQRGWIFAGFGRVR